MSPAGSGGVTVFVGPTLTPDEVVAVLPGAAVRGPVSCGEVLALTARAATPGTIAIIDGYFEHRLPVWHKEILWALARGWRVYGGASMGALRAAELAAFGMIGVGQIFTWYQDGSLEDDDEVAVVHQDAQGGYRPLCDAMVNVRATLAAAVTAGALAESTAARLMAAVKAVPYPRRSLRRTLAGWLPEESWVRRLAAWLETTPPVDLKRADALALLARVARDELCGAAPPPPWFVFAHTEAWQELLRTSSGDGSREVAGAGAQPVADCPAEDLLEEVQLGPPEAFAALWQDATLRALAGALGPAPAEQVRAAIIDALPAVLAERGQYAMLAARALDKSALLAAASEPAVKRPRAELLHWHFSLLGRAVPADLAAQARALGFEDAEGLLLAVAREHWYLERRTSDAGNRR